MTGLDFMDGITILGYIVTTATAAGLAYGLIRLLLSPQSWGRDTQKMTAHGTAMIMLYLGDLAMQEKKIKDAHCMYEEAIALCKGVRDRQGEVTISRKLAPILVLLGKERSESDEKEAFSMFGRALQYYIVLDDSEGQAVAAEEMAAISWHHVESEYNDLLKLVDGIAGVVGGDFNRNHIAEEVIEQMKLEVIRDQQREEKRAKSPNVLAILLTVAILVETVIWIFFPFTRSIFFP